MGEFLRAEVRGRAQLPAARRPRSCGRSAGRWPTCGCWSSGRTPTRPPGTRSGCRSRSRPTSGRCRRAWSTSTRSWATTSAARRRRSGDLTPWFEQGVMLLNRVPHRRARARRPRTAAAAGRRSPSRPSTALADARRSAGGDPVGPRRAGPQAGARRRCRGWSRCTPARCRRRAGSSGPGRSAGSTPCSRSRAARRWTGGCREPARRCACSAARTRARARRTRRRRPRWARSSPGAAPGSCTAARGVGLMGTVADAALAAGGRGRRRHPAAPRRPRGRAHRAHRAAGHRLDARAQGA